MGRGLAGHAFAAAAGVVGALLAGGLGQYPNGTGNVPSEGRQELH